MAITVTLTAISEAFCRVRSCGYSSRRTNHRLINNAFVYVRYFASFISTQNNEWLAPVARLCHIVE